MDLVVIEAHVGDVPEPGDGVTAAVEHQLLQRLDAVETPDCAQQVAPFAAFDVAAGDVAVARAHRGADVSERQAALGESSGIDANLHLPLGAAPDPHLRDAGNALHAGSHVIFDVVPDHVHVDAAGIARQGRDAKIHEGVIRERRRIDARLAHRDGIARYLTQGVVNANQRLIDVDAERKFELDARRARIGRRDHALQARDVAQVLLLLDQDLLLDVLGCSTGPERAHGNGSHLEIRNHLHRDAQHRNHAENADHENRDGQQQTAFQDGFEHDGILAVSASSRHARADLRAGSRCRARPRALPVRCRREARCCLRSCAPPGPCAGLRPVPRPRP